MCEHFRTTRKDTVDEAIDRLVAKQILERDGDTVRRR